MFEACDCEPRSVTEAPSRRRFLQGLVAGAALLALRPIHAAAQIATLGAPREVGFVHTHTNEALSVVYWRDGRYVPEALTRVNEVLRDWRTGDVVQMDPQLLDLLHDLARITGTREPYHVICGYRTSQTNEMLRSRSAGVASNSQHILGRAIDVRLPDIPISQLRDAAIALQRGGVGYYGQSDFVHLDTARVRTW